METDSKKIDIEFDIGKLFDRYLGSVAVILIEEDD